jgi:hypothetical protein
MRGNARRTFRYWILRLIYRQYGLVNVPLIGPKGDGKRDCTAGIQAALDELGGWYPIIGTYRVRYVSAPEDEGLDVWTPEDEA